MKIYVAGKFKEREQVKKIMHKLSSKGHIITCDWTNHIAPEEYLDKDFDWAQNGHRTYAQEDLNGVSQCDLLFAYMPNPNIFYKGAWIEIGIAIGLHKKILLVGQKITTVFLGLPNIQVISNKKKAFDIIDSMQFNIDYKDGAKNKDTDHFIS